MDDYNVNVLSEAKNEYCSRLLNIVTPLVIQGIQSIYKEACDLCAQNDEHSKYLMTFQNFLTRVPKWNTNIIYEETERILKSSECPYLEDLLTCVHITQLKVLTSIRVSQKQKKIDIDIPKLKDFIHKVYICFARKLYGNVYLFEKDILPLQYQKNMRECEVLCRESILIVIRDSIPVEKILRSYIDETVDEEIIEEIIEKNMTEREGEKLKEELEEKARENEEGEEEPKIKKLNEPTSLGEKNDKKEEDTNDFTDSFKALTEKLEETNKNGPVSLKMNVEPFSSKKQETKSKNDNPEPIKMKIEEKPSVGPPRLSFNDNDAVLDMGTNKESTVSAPKTIERLEKISAVNDAKRKAEEAEEEDDDYDEEPLKIHSGESIDLKLDSLDSLDKKDSSPKLDFEVLI
jgi:hypothetical protein